jgi:hypothetical protein
VQKTRVGIDGERITIDGAPTCTGRSWQGRRVEGLLMNARFVQATFDDENAETRSLWRYPDTGVWDAERNTREFIAMMPSWRSSGLLAFTLNLQGGNPRGYQPKTALVNSAFTPAGQLVPAYMHRLEAILSEADRLGMVVILGLFYFGQDHRFEDEAAIRTAAAEATRWVLERGWRNVMIELANECDNRKYTWDILKPQGAAELFGIVRRAAAGAPLLLSTSFCGNVVPTDEVLRLSDFVLLHGNGIDEPGRLASLIDETRGRTVYRGQPVVVNEDDHFAFDSALNHFTAAVGRYASWGLLDCGANDYKEGYQSPPVNWTHSTERKRGFFRLLEEMTTR